MIFRFEWCCQHSDVWENTEEGPPCIICPLYDTEMDEFNLFCYERWKYLDVLGRDRAFSEMPLREEAIDAHLNRYGANNPDVYETLFKIEIELFGHRQKEEQKKKEAEERKRKAESAAQRSRQGGRMPSRSSSVPKRASAPIRRK